MVQNRIAWYANGRCPLNRLIVIREGYNATDGHWQHRLPRATLRRFRSLQARAARRSGGRVLAITAGWATDRPYEAQVTAKRVHGIYAATPGTSSHGMVFEGQQTAAIDVGNWAWVYENCGGYNAWLADLRAEGFDRLPAGYPLDGERHHIIDYNPWDDEPEFGGAPAGSGASPFEEDDMFTDEDRAMLAHLKAVSDNTVRSGYGHQLDEGDLGTILNRIDSIKGGPHPTRNDYGRGLDLGDLQTILNAIADAARPVAPDAAVSIQAIADAVADEIDARARERLNE